MDVFSVNLFLTAHSPLTLLVWKKAILRQLLKGMPCVPWNKENHEGLKQYEFEKFHLMGELFL